VWRAAFSDRAAEAVAQQSDDPMGKLLKTAVIAALAMGLLAAMGGAAYVWLGVYDISATRPHTQAVYSLLEYTMQQSVRRRAVDVQTPALDDPGWVLRGAACYRQHCVQCHGGPGAAQGPMGRSMQPLPGPLVDAATRWQAAELYWITRHGIKMSGMPAWEQRLPDDDLWALVAFMQQLPGLSPAAFRELGAVSRVSDADPVAAPLCPAAERAALAGDLRPGRAERGRLLLGQFACSACHKIPGAVGSDVNVGPPLAGMARRATIAGALPNTPEQMVRWIRDPQSVDPQTTMPDLEVGEQDARDIAAYLATLH
jgi:mono/diheme cytochrome c family protein